MQKRRGDFTKFHKILFKFDENTKFFVQNPEFLLFSFISILNLRIFHKFSINLASGSLVTPYFASAVFDANLREIYLRCFSSRSHPALGLSKTKMSFTDTSNLTSWTDDLPVCWQSGIGFASNELYRKDGRRTEMHPVEDRSFHFRNDLSCYFTVVSRILREINFLEVNSVKVQGVFCCSDFP